MILSSSVRAYVCAEPVDMRKQIDGLAQLVESVFAADVFGGIDLSRARRLPIVHASRVA